jgi:hypothetical protein
MLIINKFILILLHSNFHNYIINNESNSNNYKLIFDADTYIYKYY